MRRQATRPPGSASRRSVFLVFLSGALAAAPAVAQGSPPAFPGAEGFGAVATGGRGGQVIYVTTLAPQGPGSLDAALRTRGPRYVLFKVSGLIDGLAEIAQGDVTVAGQTSPGGIMVRGLVCGDNYEAGDDCRNVIVRHLRSRPRPVDAYPGTGPVLDDGLRLDGARRVIVDHGSFANAVDEVVQISMASDVTVQHSLFAETVGSHYEFGGLLINYASDSRPLTRITLHHNTWNRIYQRLPEISCESPACAGQKLDLEISSNLLWDAGFFLTYTGDIDPAGGPGRFFLNLNWIDNYLVGRPTFPFGMISDGVVTEPQNALFFSGNRLNLYPAYADYQLAYCCNDFATAGPNQTPPLAQVRSERHPFPSASSTPATHLVRYMVARAGALPRDPMDRRLMRWVEAGQIDPTHWSVAAANDAWDLDFDPARPPSPPADTDEDGMPDDWERGYGLDPLRQDHNGTELSVRLTGVEGYTNLEVYLDQLASLAAVPTGGGVRRAVLTGALALALFRSSRLRGGRHRPDRGRRGG